MKPAMAIPLNKTATASYPRILGIRYDPAAFTLPDSTRAAWDWEANAEALQAINAAGGTVRRINGATAELSGLPQLLASTDNQFVQQHLQNQLQGVVISLPNHAEISPALNLTLRTESAFPVEWTVWFDLGVHSRLTTKLTLDLAGEVQQSNCLIGGALADESNLTLITDTQSHQATRSLLLGDFVSARDANLDWSLWPQTKGQLLGDLNVTLAGTGSRATLNLARYGYQDDWVGIRGQIKHLGQHTFSRINMRGVLYENSRVNFTSIGQIDHGASDADADQESRLMTVEPHAKGSVNPVLVIDENDVRAGHAASVGQYDEDALYYLQSRGLPMETAKQILIDNFMEPIWCLRNGVVG